MARSDSQTNDSNEAVIFSVSKTCSATNVVGFF